MGRAVASQLAQKGANIVIVARNVKKLQDATEQIKVCAAFWMSVSRAREC